MGMAMMVEELVQRLTILGIPREVALDLTPRQARGICDTLEEWLADLPPPPRGSSSSI